jgi:ribosomal protein S18 acetylase RimI-like enzyme
MVMTTKINKVNSTEIDQVMLLIKAAVTKMERDGIHQWDDDYPNTQIISEDIASSTLYGISADNCLAGIIVLNESLSPEYQSIPWTDKNGQPLVIHRLCIHPDFQGQGLAKKLVLFAENYARENKYSSIRLDAFINNKTALGLYDALNYRNRGRVTFRIGDFCCYEKCFSTNS